MRSNRVIWTVGLQCRPQDEDKFNKWYDEVHVPMLLKGGHVSKVTRYELADAVYDVAPGAMKCPKYQTVYEFEDQQKFEAWMHGEERMAAGRDKAEAWGDRGYEVIWAARYDVTSTWTD
ncbi:MAG: EthD family reductase [Steroidobacteraceae bacterium]|nr:EthD family reductase [Nevskiaceae bacterium]MCP5472498.1 EthD family reductase [Nevskiaceae bacterium]